MGAPFLARSLRQKWGFDSQMRRPDLNPARSLPTLYYITDSKSLADDKPSRRRSLLEKIAEAARSGVDYIQLREKDLSTRELESFAREAIRVINELKAQTPNLRTELLINSRTDVALSVGAQGVHLRSDDISAREVEAIWRTNPGTAAKTGKISPPTPTIGVSCHTPDEVAKAAADGTAFTVFAPVFEKKASAGAQPTGLHRLREACKINIPVLALGGVTLANAQSCLEAGAKGIAAIRLFQENDIAEIVRNLRSTS